MRRLAAAVLAVPVIATIYLGIALTVPQAAAALQVSVPAAYRLVASGVLPTVKLGPRLTRVPLDVLRAHRARLRALVGEFLAAGLAGGKPLPCEAVEVRDLLARQDAYLLGAKALLLRTHARLEHGVYSEIETALLPVWLM